MAKKSKKKSPPRCPKTGVFLKKKGKGGKK